MERRSFFAALAATFGVGCALKTEDESNIAFAIDLEEPKAKPYELLHEHLLTTLHRCRWREGAPMSAEMAKDLDGHIGELQLADDMFRQAWPKFDEKQRDFFTSLVTDAITDARKTLEERYY